MFHCIPCSNDWCKVQLQFHALHTSDSYDKELSQVHQRMFLQGKPCNQALLDMEYDCHKVDTIHDPHDKSDNSNKWNCRLIWLQCTDFSYRFFGFVHKIPSKPNRKRNVSLYYTSNETTVEPQLSKHWLSGLFLLVSSAAVIWVVTQCFSPTTQTRFVSAD